MVERTGDLLELTGPDRLRLLQGLVTADVKSAVTGTAVGGFFTSGQGRILADFELLAGEDRSWLSLPAGTGESIRIHLEKYKVASRVEVRPVTDRRLFELLGPLAGEAATANGLLASASGELPLIFAGGGRFYLLPGFSPAGDHGSHEGQQATVSRVREVSARSAEIARVENGELLFGIDFSGENFPQETGRESAVSYSKGCYLGQEVVARIHYRGGVQRLPRGLRFPGGAVPQPGSELLLEGRTVGRATSVVVSPRFGAIGLGLLHQRGVAAGTQLDLDSGGTAEVVELPFGSDRPQ